MDTITKCLVCGSDDLIFKPMRGTGNVEHVTCVTCEATGMSDGQCWSKGSSRRAMHNATATVRTAFDE